MDREGFRARKKRIEQEVIDLEGRMGDQTEQLRKARELTAMAMRAVESCYESYKDASPETRKLFNQAFLDELCVQDREIVGVTYAEPFRTYLDPKKISVSNKDLLVEVNGLEPSASALRTRAPYVVIISGVRAILALISDDASQ